jgi:hypothetical protein
MGIVASSKKVREIEKTYLLSPIFSKNPNRNAAANKISTATTYYQPIPILTDFGNGLATGKMRASVEHAFGVSRGDGVPER